MGMVKEAVVQQVLKGMGLRQEIRRLKDELGKCRGKVQNLERNIRAERNRYMAGHEALVAMAKKVGEPVPKPILTDYNPMEFVKFEEERQGEEGLSIPGIGSTLVGG